MPTAPVVAPGAQKSLWHANLRILTGFSGLAGSQDRPGWLEGHRGRTNASGRATCCTK